MASARQRMRPVHSCVRDPHGSAKAMPSPTLPGSVVGLTDMYVAWSCRGAPGNRQTCRSPDRVAPVWTDTWSDRTGSAMNNGTRHDTGQ